MALGRALLSFTFASLVVAGARAHSLPFGTRLVWESADASGAPPLIVTNRGLVFRDEVDGTMQSSLRCGAAYNANGYDRPPVFLDDSGRVTVSVYSGVLSTSDRGCSWQAATGLPPGESLANAARVAGPPSRLLVSTRTFKGITGVFKSEDDGRTFSESFKNPTDQFYEYMVGAPSDPQRVYAGGQRADRVNTTVLFLCSVSLDGGETWQDQIVPPKLVPFAVHPTNADVVFGYQPTDRQETEYRIMRSEDRGANFVSVLEYCAPPDGDAGAPSGGDAGMSADGGAPPCTPRGVLSKPLRKPTSLAAIGDVLYLGIGEAGGLFRSTDQGRTFEHVHEEGINSVTCLSVRGDRLWMCANMAPNTNGIWFSDDGGESFEKLMTFEEVTHPVMCEDLEAQVLCSADWYDFERELRPPSLDGGVGSEPEIEAGPDTGDAGAADPDAGDKPRRKRPPDCQAGSSGGPGTWSVALALGGLYATRRRWAPRVSRSTRRADG